MAVDVYYTCIYTFYSSASLHSTISVPRYITTSLWSLVVFTDSRTMSLSA